MNNHITIRLHPLSLVAGVALTLGILLVSSAFQSPTIGDPEPIGTLTGGTKPAMKVRIVNQPFSFDPRDAIVIREDDGPYVVPQGHLVVVTAMGYPAAAQESTYLNVNGQAEVYVNYDSSANSSSIIAIPDGLTIEQGSVVTLSGSSPGSRRAWGYLVDA